jgi:DNA-binding transcriptional ArsR family regulator
MEKVKSLNTLEEIKAFSDPYRIQILNSFYKFGEPVTVKQIADCMGEVPAKVHYHVKKMESAGILRLTHTREINGIIAKYYEPTAKQFIIDRPDLDPENLGKVWNEAQNAIIASYNTSQKIFLDNMEEKVIFIYAVSLILLIMLITEILEDPLKIHIFLIRQVDAGHA